MRKSKSNIGAATTSSVSPETPTVDSKSTPKGKSIISQNTDSVTKDVNEICPPEELEKNLQYSHKLLVDFAKRMLQGQPCQTRIAEELFLEHFVDNEVCENDLKLPPEQIIADAKAILHMGALLTENYSKEHDHAAKVLDEIMSRHAPSVQEAFSESNKKENSK